MINDDGHGSVTIICDCCGLDMSRDEDGVLLDGEQICSACAWDSQEQQKSEEQDRKLDNPQRGQGDRR